MQDNRGTEIEVGQKVAYNYQGQIALGKITDIRFGRPKKLSWGDEYVPCAFHIQMIAPQKDRESVVRDRRNLLVIFEQE